MTKRIFLIIVIVFLCIFGLAEIIPSYLVNHHTNGSSDAISYYTEFAKNRDNRKLIFAALIFSLIPVLYMIFAKTKKIFILLLNILVWLVLYSLTYIWVKESIVGAGFITTIINTTFIFAMMTFFMAGLLSVGSFVKQRIWNNAKDNTIFDIFMNFGIWISVFLLLTYILIACSIFYPILSWFIFAWFWYFIYLERKKLKDFSQIICSSFDSFSLSYDAKNWVKYIGIILLVFSMMYFFYGFNLSFIPYPTAWDANHAYMYYPKVWAYAHGFDRSGTSVNAWLGLWYSYISYWFSLFSPFNNFLGMSPDNIAIELNFLSWIFVLLFGLALFREVVDLLSVLSKKINRSTENYTDDENVKNVFYYIGRFLLLLWLTSWMGAFLVFVDNKTDLWVLSLVILAIYSWFVFLKKIYSDDEQIKKENSVSKEYIYYIILSGFLFAIAIMSKSTGFIDALNFWIFLFWIWIWWIGALGIFLLVVWWLAAIKFRWISDYVAPNDGFVAFVFWALCFGLDSVRSFLKKKIEYVKYILIWWVSIFVTLLIFKWPYTFVYQMKISKDFSPANFVKSLILSQNSNTQLKDNQDKAKLLNSKVYADEATGALSSTWENQSSTIPAATTWVQTVTTWLQQVASTNSVCSLSSLGLSDSTQLYTSLKKMEDTSYSEDVGRYIWFGQRNFDNPWWSMFFPGYNKCFGLDKDGLILCKNMAAIINYDFKTLKNIQPQLKKDWQPYQLISNILSGINNNVDTKVDENVKSIVWEDMDSLNSYMEDNSISVHKLCTIGSWTTGYDSDCKTITDDTLPQWKVIVWKLINIPYKYLTIFNITFNWSLQNSSSYYTDIGFIWLIVFILNVFGLLYSFCRLNKILMAFSGLTMFAWIVWFYIWWWILWYGMGLVIWNIISLVVFLYYLYTNTNLGNNSKFKKNYYAILWLNEKATDVEIKKAISRLSIKYNGDTLSEKNMLKDINEAKDILLDKEKRQEYDDSRKSKNLKQNNIEDIDIDKVLFYSFIVLFLGTCFYQIGLNFLRITSQWSWGAFTYYREGNGKSGSTTVSNGGFTTDYVDKYWYSYQDVFNLQFGHYRKTLEVANARKHWEWMFIAWTYITYFIKDQTNIRYDQFLTWLVENFSDNDPCASYLRLKDKGIKYITIDPNIWTVVMWWGNMSLFDRFFAKLNSVTGKVEDYGALLMLADMNSRWYINYVYSNNLAAKYAFILSDNELLQSIWEMTKEQIPLFRARLALMRYWQDQSLYSNFVTTVAAERVLSMDFISDIADILWKQVDENKIKDAAKIIFSTSSSASDNRMTEFQKQFDTLTEDERIVLSNYTSYYQLLQSDKEKFKTYLAQLLDQTISSGSQIITLWVN